VNSFICTLNPKKQFPQEVAEMFKKIALWSVLPIIAVTATAYSFSTVLTPNWLAHESRQDQAEGAVRVSPSRVRAGVLWPQLREYLKALGGRIEEPGKERLTLSGSINRVAQPGVPFIAILEFPDRLRFETQAGPETGVIKYDGRVSRDRWGALSNADRDLIESLVNDSVEHFFKVQAEGAPTRHLGNRFRADDGSSENYAGPYHDIFSLMETIKEGASSTSQTKRYYFNSETRLLERVTYQVSRNGEDVKVETEFSDWKKVQDQQVAHRIVRLENGQAVITLTVTSANVAAQLDDGLF
jgi:hypothetical protein